MKGAKGLLVVTVICVHHMRTIEATGQWVQTNGEKQQNMVTPWPSSFSKRYGHATVVREREYKTIEACMKAGEDESICERALVDQMFIIGGDDMDDETQAGGLLNDVWVTAGINFLTHESDVDSDEFGAKVIRRSSRMKWKVVAGTFLGYPEYCDSYWQCIACQLENWRVPAYCNPDQTEWQARRWLPRRNHQAVMFGGDMFVLGGTSRNFEDLPPGWERVHGGIIPPRGSRKREQMIPRNDIWKSSGTTMGSDGSWEIVSPGCLPDTQQSDLVWRSGKDDRVRGTRGAQCTDNTDCYLETKCKNGVCECNMWAPRELFGATSVALQNGTQFLFVFGGFTHVRKQSCADYACGGGYQKALNDVWYSKDGVVWNTGGLGTLNRPHSDMTHWSPRGGFGFAIKPSNALGDRLYLYGGKSVDTMHYENEEYHNDVWMFGCEDLPCAGPEWHLEVKEAPWSKRANFVSMRHNRDLIVIGGVSESGIMGDVWVTVQGNVLEWKMDYAPEDRYQYITIEDHIGKIEEVSYWPIVPDGTAITPLTEEQITKLEDANVSTIADLALISQEQIFHLQNYHLGNFADVCKYHYYAKAIYDKCNVRAKFMDTDSLPELDRKALFENEVIQIGQERIQGVEMLAKDIPDDIDLCATTTPEWEVLDWSLDLTLGEDAEWSGPAPVVCKYAFKPVAFTTGASYQQRAFIMGGRGHELMNSVWYRDVVVPQLVIRDKPSPPDDTSETDFRFDILRDPAAGEEEVNVIYEYQIWDTSTTPHTMARHWASTREFLSVAWLESGPWKIQARAVDLSGNTDVQWVSIIGQNNNPNEYRWNYNAPLPWELIIAVILIAFALVVLAYAVHRYRQRQLALRRFAMKHMRRKFKRTQKEKSKKNKKKKNVDAKDARKAKLAAYAKVARSREVVKKHRSGKSKKKSSKSKSHKKKK